MQNFEEEKEKKPISWPSVIFTSVAIIIIVALVGLYYYYSTKKLDEQFGQTNLPVVPQAEKKQEPKIASTDVIFFMPPVLNSSTKSQNGQCFASSVAQPYRVDAWRCQNSNSIYDPCFAVGHDNLVFCEENPLSNSAIVIKYAKLPKPTIPSVKKDNWAWFLQIDDNTFCVPYTGTKPLPDIYYGCKSDTKGETVVLGELSKGAVWTAKKTILTKDSTGKTTVKSSEIVNIKTVWQ